MLTKLFSRSSEPKPDITAITVLPWSEFSPRVSGSTQEPRDAERPPWEDGDIAADPSEITVTGTDDAAESTATNSMVSDAGTATNDAAIIEEAIEQCKKMTPWQLAGCSKGNFYRQKRLARLMTEIEDGNADRERLEAELSAAQTTIRSMQDEIDRLKSEQQGTVPIDGKLLAILKVSGIKNADTLKSLLVMDEAEFNQRIRLEMERQAAAAEALYVMQSAAIQGATHAS